MFFDNGGYDLSTSGVALDLAENDTAPDLVHVFAVHAVTIGDAKALVQILGSIGYNGLVPCPCCRNIVSITSGLAEYDETLQPLSSLHPDSWKLHCDLSVRRLLLRLGARADDLGSTAFRKLETRCGWHYHPLNIALDEELGYKAISTLYYDWMHVFMVDGTYGREVNALLEAFREKRNAQTMVSFNDLDEYLRMWTWPLQLPGAKNACGTGTWAATASESLSAAPVLARFFRDVVPAEGFETEIASFLKLSEVVDILQNASKGIVTPIDLFVATVSWLEAHLAAYGTQYFVFKHHQAMHLPGMWARSGILLNCFALERHHKLAKRFMKDHTHTRSYEKSVLEEITLEKYINGHNFAPRVC